jgi:hypothetical protein
MAKKKKIKLKLSLDALEGYATKIADELPGLTGHSWRFGFSGGIPCFLYSKYRIGIDASDSGDIILSGHCPDLLDGSFPSNNPPSWPVALRMPLSVFIRELFAARKIATWLSDYIQAATHALIERKTIQKTNRKRTEILLRLAEVAGIVLQESNLRSCSASDSGYLSHVAVDDDLDVEIYFDSIGIDMTLKIFDSLANRGACKSLRMRTDDGQDVELDNTGVTLTGNIIRSIKGEDVAGDFSIALHLNALDEQAASDVLNVVAGSNIRCARRKLASDDVFVGFRQGRVSRKTLLEAIAGDIFQYYDISCSLRADDAKAQKETVKEDNEHGR